MRSSNPALRDSTFSTRADQGQDAMTIRGTVNKSFLLIAMVFASAYWSWSQSYPNGWGAEATPEIPGWYLPIVLIALVMAFIIIFKKTTAPFLVPVYAILEGLVLGALSAMFEVRFPGIVFQAVMLTMGTFMALLFAYKSQLIKATENFKLGIAAATGGIAIVYLIDLGLRFFGKSVPMIHESSPMGIAFSVVVVCIAALNLVMDFDFIEKGAENRAPKYMEWYAAFGLLVTLVWLYLEILRLLSKSRK